MRGTLDPVGTWEHRPPVDYGAKRRSQALTDALPYSSGLSFGDCFAYALAKSLGEPLLFKGEDFSETDIESAAA